MNLSSDLGEGAGTDDAILGQLDSASVCCGVHAGSMSETLATVRRCHRWGVEVGAHPGYDDRQGFGRTELGLLGDQIEALARFQVGALAAVARIGYLKPHGALYHRCRADREAARALARVAADFQIGVLAQPGAALLDAARELGVARHREAFADRGYLPDGSLVPRDRPGALLAPEEAAEQGLRLARAGLFDSLCIHGDSPGAAETARLIRQALTAAGIRTGPLSALP